jgi:hypothetical protein
MPVVVIRVRKLMIAIVRRFDGRLEASSMHSYCSNWEANDGWRRKHECTLNFEFFCKPPKP